MSGTATIPDAVVDDEGALAPEDYADVQSMIKAHDLFHRFGDLDRISPANVVFTDTEVINDLTHEAWAFILPLTGRSLAEHGIPSRRSLKRVAVLISLFGDNPDECRMCHGGTPTSGPLR